VIPIRQCPSRYPVSQRNEYHARLKTAGQQDADQSQDHNLAPANCLRLGLSQFLIYAVIASHGKKLLAFSFQQKDINTFSSYPDLKDFLLSLG
jgi:hypothetical protein